MVRAPVGEAMDEPGVAVVGEDHGPVGGEERVELGVGQPVGVLAGGLKAHEIDDVHHAHAELGQMLAKQGDRGQRFQRRHVARTGEHDVGGGAGIVRRPFENPDAACAVKNRFVDRQPVRGGLLAGHDHVDVVLTAQAVIRH